ncbi:hypothetical protein [Stenotrophomonas sp.]|nr:hypothetical protein [Stenotrophomonas sp.]
MNTPFSKKCIPRRLPLDDAHVLGGTKLSRYGPRLVEVVREEG